MTRPLSHAVYSCRLVLLSGLGWLLGSGMIGNEVKAQTSAAVDPMPATPVTVTPKVLPSLASPTPTEAAVPAEPEPDLAPPQAGNGAFIDRTNYSLGATQRTEPSIAEQPTPRGTSGAVASVPVPEMPVQVQDFKAPGIGARWTPPEPVNPVGQAYETVKNFYNRTVRPIGRVGNGDLRVLFPVSIPSPITSLFGWRIHPLSGDARFHAGTDIGAPMGTPVLAALTGRVIFADLLGGYGLSAALEHKDGSQQTLYAHMSEIFVKPGDIVKQGTVIGRVGSTGASTGAHLHFEFRQQTTEGWVAMDAGVALETAMAELVKSMQFAQKPSNETRTP